MSESNKVLKRYASSKSKYFDLPDGEEKTVRFLYAEEVPNHFDGGKTTCVRYHLEIDGHAQMWDRTSRELATQMAELSEGDIVTIKRVGQKNKTKYTIRKVM